jgi:hypothetical protein
MPSQCHHQNNLKAQLIWTLRWISQQEWTDMNNAVGELGKILSPSKSRIPKVHETSSRSGFLRKVCVCEKGQSEESR